MSNLVLRSNLSRPLTHNELDANMRYLEVVEWLAKDFRAGQFAYITVTGTTTLYLCLETHTVFVYDNNGGNFAETITVNGTPITFWRKISGGGVGSGTSGFSGTSGLSYGTSGSDGAAGTSGSSGLSYGTSGSNGATGPAGTSGTSSYGGLTGVFIIKLEYASGSLVASPFVNAKDPSGNTITSGSGGWIFTRNGANEITITHPLGVWPINFMTHAQLSTGNFMSRMMHGTATTQSVVVQNTAKTTMNFKALSTTAMGIYGTGTAYAYITFQLPSNDIFI
jgi:hypothetical protein